MPIKEIIIIKEKEDPVHINEIEIFFEQLGHEYQVSYDLLKKVIKREGDKKTFNMSMNIRTLFQYVIPVLSSSEIAEGISITLKKRSKSLYAKDVENNIQTNFIYLDQFSKFIFEGYVRQPYMKRPETRTEINEEIIYSGRWTYEDLAYVLAKSVSPENTKYISFSGEINDIMFDIRNLRYQKDYYNGEYSAYNVFYNLSKILSDRYIKGDTIERYDENRSLTSVEISKKEKSSNTIKSNDLIKINKKDNQNKKSDLSQPLQSIKDFIYTLNTIEINAFKDFFHILSLGLLDLYFSRIFDPDGFKLNYQLEKKLYELRQEQIKINKQEKKNTLYFKTLDYISESKYHSSFVNLKENQKKIVLQDYKRREDYNKSIRENTCDHIKYVNTDKIKQFLNKSIIKNDITLVKETTFLKCNVCGFDAICPHKIYMRTHDIKLTSKYFSDQSLQTQNDVYSHCTICGEVLETLESNDEFRMFSRGKMILKEFQDSPVIGALKKELNFVIRNHIEFKNMINIVVYTNTVVSNLAEYLDVIYDDILKAKTMNDEQKSMKLHLYAAIYVYAFICKTLESSLIRKDYGFIGLSVTGDSSNNIIEIVKFALGILLKNKETMISMFDIDVKQEFSTAFKKFSNKYSAKISEKETKIQDFTSDPLYLYFWYALFLDFILTTGKSRKFFVAIEPYAPESMKYILNIDLDDNIKKKRKKKLVSTKIKGGGEISGGQLVIYTKSLYDELRSAAFKWIDKKNPFHNYLKMSYEYILNFVKTKQYLKDIESIDYSQYFEIKKLEDMFSNIMKWFRLKIYLTWTFRIDNYYLIEINFVNINRGYAYCPTGEHHSYTQNVCNRCKWDRTIIPTNVDISLITEKNEYNDFWKFFEFRCPEGFLHKYSKTFGNNHTHYICDKCGYNKNYNLSHNRNEISEKNQSSLYYKKYKPKYLATDNILVDIIHPDYKLLLQSTEQLDYTNDNLIKLSTILKIDHTILFNLGLNESINEEDFKAGRKTDIGISRTYRLLGYMNRIISEYFIVKNIEKVMVIELRLKNDLLDLHSKSNNKEKIIDLDDFILQIRNEISKNMINSDYVLARIGDILIKLITKNKDTISYMFVEYIIKYILEFESFYFKPQELKKQQMQLGTDISQETFDKPSLNFEFKGDQDIFANDFDYDEEDKEDDTNANDNFRKEE